MHDEHFRRDAFGPGADAAAESEHVQRCFARSDEYRGFGAANPVRNHYRFATHIRKTILLHLGEHPVDGLLERSRATEPVAETVDQCAEPPIRLRVCQRRARDAVRGRCESREIGGRLRAGDADDETAAGGEGSGKATGHECGGNVSCDDGVVISRNCAQRECGHP